MGSVLLIGGIMAVMGIVYLSNAVHNKHNHRNYLMDAFMSGYCVAWFLYFLIKVIVAIKGGQ